MPSFSMPSIRTALRKLAQSPFVTLVAVVSLALGIGANAAIFSIFEQILLRGLPVVEPDRLVNLAVPGPKPGSQSCGGEGSCDEVFSYPMLKDLQAGETGFSSIAGHVSFGASVATGEETVAGTGAYVTGSYFGTLGVRPALGRLLDEGDEGEPGENFVVVLSHDFWVGRLAGDPSILNRSMIVNGHPMTVVGVAQAGFRGTSLGTDPEVYVPISMRPTLNPGWTGLDNRSSYWIYAFGRLAPGITLDAAQERTQRLYTGIVQEVEAPLNDFLPDAAYQRFLTKPIVLEPGRLGQSDVHDEAGTPLTLLLVVTGVVLLIACANVANLMLARAARREGELAVRASLGASRLRLIGDVLTEALLLAALGGIAAIGVTWITVRGVLGFLPDGFETIMRFELSPSLFVFVGLASVTAGLLFGLFPALHTTRTELVALVKTQGSRSSGSRLSSRFRTSLATAQVALSMALLVTAGLFLRSLTNVARVEVGMDPTDVLTFEINPQRNGYTPEERHAFYTRLEERLAAHPGVASVTTSMVPVLGGGSWGTDLQVEGLVTEPGRDMNARYNEIGADYFSKMRVPLLAGREFTDADRGDAAPVAVVNEAFLKKFEIDRARAVGTRIGRSTAGEPRIEIVGVIPDTKYANVKDTVPPVFYTPWKQDAGLDGLHFYVRADGDLAAIAGAIPAAVRELDPNLPVEGLVRFEDRIRENVFLDRMMSVLAATFGGLATLLAAVGLYGVLAYSVEQRTREIGVRMALGAQRGEVRAMVLRQMARMAGIGAVAGGVLAVFIGRSAQSLLYELGGSDPVVIVLAGLVLGGVALAAGYIPAGRASGVDPLEALRYE
ncbi:MAG: ABC transporter permease [Longimicrobiales bacterium]|nr:ABC transporter permease [Longimicrobiales bacterium]